MSFCYSKVSVIVPVYNESTSNLKRCIGSILDQSYTNIELVIIDDGSDEPIESEIREMFGDDKRIVVERQVNGGVCAARNKGVSLASGDFIMFLDADDIISKNSINSGMEIVREYSADLVIGGTVDIRNYDEFDSRESYRKVLKVDSQIQMDDIIHLYFNDKSYCYRNNITQGYISRGCYARIINKKIADSVLFPTELSIGEDVVWNLRLLKQCKRIYICDEVWTGYMIHGGSAIRRYYGNRRELVEKYLNTLRIENVDFCRANETAEAMNIMIEYYCLLRFELLSKNCLLSKNTKNSIAKEILNSCPWNILKEHKIRNLMPFKYRILIVLVEMNCWQPYILLRSIKGA